MFLDGPQAKVHDAVHVVFSGEKVRANDPEPVTPVDDAESIENIRTMPPESLIRMKFTSCRDKDRAAQPKFRNIDGRSAGLVYAQDPDGNWLEFVEGL